MNIRPIAELLDVIEAGVASRLCVQAWIGQAAVLFLGFGDEILPPPLERASGQREHLLPPYEIKAAYSSWQVIGDGRVLMDSNDLVTNELRRGAERRISELVGKRVIDWRVVLPGWCLTVNFEGALSLVMLPYDDAYQEDRDIWKIRRPDGYMIGVTGRSEIYMNYESDRPRQRRLS